MKAAYHIFKAIPTIHTHYTSIITFNFIGYCHSATPEIFYEKR